MEAIILAGGRGERLGGVSGGRPKPLVPVGGRPLAAYQVVQLAAAGVPRVVVSCAAGTGALFRHALGAIGPEIVPVEEPEPLGRGGGLRLASEALGEDGPCFALNGDELVDLDLRALLDRHAATGAAATIAVARPKQQFGVVDLTDDDVVTGFREADRVPYWVNCGVYVLDDEALALFPEKGDHETTAFPELAAAGRLRAFRHEGVWLTVNTPKELRVADEYVREHPERFAVTGSAVAG